MKLELLTNAIVVDEAIRIVSEHTQSKNDINYQKEGEEVAAQKVANNITF
jgi:predicted nucleic acid-binding protein